MSEHPAGWYPDPRGRHEYRYWDGTVWTDHVADQGQASTDPVDVVGPKASADSPAEATASSTTAAASAASQSEPVREPEPERSASSSPSAADAATAGSSSLWTTDPSEAPLSGDAPDPVQAREPARDPEPTAGPEPTVDPPPVTAAGSDPGRADAEGTPATGGTRAADALRSATATKSPALAGLLTVVLPGSGHFYLGAGSKAGLAVGLLAATLAAYIIAWFSFTSFIIAFVIWAAAAAYGIFDLQGVLKPIREAGAAAASISPQQVGLVLVTGGALLIVGLLLPWYNISFDVELPAGVFGTSRDASQSVSGFQISKVIDLVLLLIGAATIVLGLASMGLGPLSSRPLPSWLPAAVAGAGAVAVVLVAYRLAVDPLPGSFGVAGVSVGRGPGILLDGAAALGIAAAGLVALIQSPRASSSATP